MGRTSLSPLLCGYIKLLKMYKYSNLVTKFMSKYELYEKGINRQPRSYPLFRMFSPHAFVGTGGRGDDVQKNDKGKFTDMELLVKF